MQPEYGPPAGESWTELYLIYGAELMPKFKQCRFVDPERPIWPIADLAAVNIQIAELALLTRATVPEAVVDRVDRVCERLVLETHLAPSGGTGEEHAIHTLIAGMRRNLGEFVDFDEAAARHGMSPSTFRRRWAAVSDVPPARFLQQLRIREACRRLVETGEPVGEIAHAVGFDDELYFSRRFHQEMRMAPRDYRKAYRIRQPGE